jgi:peptidyl-prolyl cis-trans isomerase SurA
MKAFMKKSKIEFFLCWHLIPFVLLSFPSYSYWDSQDDVLIIVHDKEITKDEFLYHFQKDNQEINQQNIKEYLKLFIDFRLKVAQAMEEGMDRNIGFINELTEYRILLAAPYLTDREKEEELIQEAMDRLHFEVSASHILLKLNPDNNAEDTLVAYAKAIQIRNRLLNGEPFEQLALSASQDELVTQNSGNLGYFTAFQTEYPIESAVYALDTTGEISMPVRTNYGYHIIRLNDRRRITGEVKSKDEVKKLIYDAKDERAQIIKTSFVNRLKKDWGFIENLGALEIIIKLADERVYKGMWIGPADHPFDTPLFYADGKVAYQKDFIKFMSDQETLNNNTSIRDYIFSLYQQFVSSWLITYENYKLEEKYPIFRFQMQEYRDAMLLLAITREKVWLKARSDTAGLEAFYNENKDKYMWGKRIYASIFTAENKQSAQQGVKMASKSFRKGENDLWELLNHINHKTDGESLTADQGIFSRGDHPIIDQITWKKGFSGIINLESKYHFVFIHDILEPTYKSIDEAYDNLFADYQDHLMNEWINELRSTYYVQINESLLSTIFDDMH